MRFFDFNRCFRLLIVSEDQIFDKPVELKSSFTTDAISVLILVGGLMYVALFKGGLSKLFVGVIQMFLIFLLVLYLYLDRKRKLPKATTYDYDFYFPSTLIGTLLAVFFLRLYLTLYKAWASYWIFLFLTGLFLVLLVPSSLDELSGTVACTGIYLSAMAILLHPPLFIIDIVTFLYLAHRSDASKQNMFLGLLEQKLRSCEVIRKEDIECWYRMRIEIKHAVYIMRLLIPLGFIVVVRIRRGREVLSVVDFEEISPSLDVLLQLTIRLPTLEELKINEILGYESREMSIKDACHLLGVDEFLLRLMARKYPNTFAIHKDTLIYKPPQSSQRENHK